MQRSSVPSGVPISHRFRKKYCPLIKWKRFCIDHHNSVSFLSFRKAKGLLESREKALPYQIRSGFGKTGLHMVRERFDFWLIVAENRPPPPKQCVDLFFENCPYEEESTFSSIFQKKTIGFSEFRKTEL